ncbi:PmeII family type II restriction endonuclease [Phocaeicola barnesiae]|uniref:PmeII family type II restriction endonuclease n=1 Tax=Phocaeicola barnesiae TaxID=376804 RepID=UPI00241D0D15|nr:PmeII family type II restriction endonuclease [Phocaeicola barnesiae]
MTEEQKSSIINSGKEYFRSTLIPNHLRNLEKLSLREFNVNPFTINYLAAFLCGNTEPESLAKALVYPRVLGTSFNTSFGQNIQVFISQLAQLTGNASGIDGIDIEFVDAIDGRRKYCQCKAGPQTINKDDISTILGHFKHLIGKARLDRLPIQLDDLIVGVLYGEHENLSANYRAIESHYPVYCGAEFWERITGDAQFYYRLAKAFGEVVEEDGIDGSQLLQAKIAEIAEEIRNKEGI